jgi:hypothetical protein
MHPELMLMLARYRQQEFWREAARARRVQLTRAARSRRRQQICWPLRKALWTRTLEADQLSSQWQLSSKDG